MTAALVDLACVVLGSLLGAPARYFVSGVVARRFGETFPWGTMAVNVSGTFLIGLLAAATTAEPALAARPWQFAAVGLLGSYTTVSSFSLQTLTLARDGELLGAMRNIVLSLVLCLGAAALGYLAGPTVSRALVP